MNTIGFVSVEENLKTSCLQGAAAATARRNAVWMVISWQLIKSNVANLAENTRFFLFTNNSTAEQI